MLPAIHYWTSIFLRSWGTRRQKSRHLSHWAIAWCLLQIIFSHFWGRWWFGPRSNLDFLDFSAGDLQLLFLLTRMCHLRLSSVCSGAPACNSWPGQYIFPPDSSFDSTCSRRRARPESPPLSCSHGHHLDFRPLRCHWQRMLSTDPYRSYWLMPNCCLQSASSISLRAPSSKDLCPYILISSYFVIMKFNLIFNQMFKVYNNVLLFQT